MTKICTKGAAQGDILIIARGQIPRLDVDTSQLVPAADEHGRLILARGEATGHHHSLPHQRGAVLFRDTSNVPLAFRVDEAAPLEHQEHSTITFAPSKQNPAGEFSIIQQRTYHAGMARKVVD